MRGVVISIGVRSSGTQSIRMHPVLGSIRLGTTMNHRWRNSTGETSSTSVSQVGDDRSTIG